MARALATVLLAAAAAGLVGSFGACSSFSGEPRPATEAGSDAPAPDATPSSAYRDAILAATPIAYWRMGITDGGVVPDESGRNNDLTLQGGVVLGQPGALDADKDTAIRFDGKSGSARASNPRAFDFPGTQAFTIELWAKRDDLGPGAQRYQHLVSHSEGSQTNRTGFLLYVAPDPPSSACSFEVYALGNLEQATTKPPVVAGQWAHYAAVVDDGGRLTLYVDGGASVAQPRKGPMTVTTAALVIGADDGGNWFGGTIDEVAIYAKALTSTEIQTHYNLKRR